MTRVSVDEAFDIARQFQNAGRLGDAEAVYQQILSADPNHVNALQMLGMIEHERGNSQRALELLGKAVALRPDFASCHSNFGMVLASLGETDRAIGEFEQATALNPNAPEAFNNLGTALQSIGKMDQAIDAYQRAVALRPEFSMAQNNLAAALCEAGRIDEGIECFKRVIALEPNFFQGYANLGKAYLKQKDPKKAGESFDRALELQGTDIETMVNKGVALQLQGRVLDAMAAYRQALSLRSNLPDAWLNLGTALQQTQHLDEAIDAYQRSLAIRHDLADAHGNLAAALAQTGRMDEALAEHRIAQSLNPSRKLASTFLVFTHMHPDFTPQMIFEEHVRWREKSVRPQGPRRFHHAPPSRSQTDRRLRIGYVSAYFNNRPAGRFLSPLLESHDHAQFEIICYNDCLEPDEGTQRLRTYADVWRETHQLQDTALADLINADKIDILVDLGMHTRGNRIFVFAQKPAPIQVTYLAYCSTTGLESIDYRISDPFLDPDDANQPYYSEKTVRLRSYWCYPAPMSAPPVSDPPFRAHGYITFGCLNDYPKINPRVLSLWARVLNAVPDSHLLLHSPEGSHRERALQIFQEQGVASSRIEFVPMVPMNEYFQKYQQIDIALDPFPWAGGTTSCDALWMGVPVVSFVGATAVSRAGQSILSQIDLSELVATQLDDYLHLAVNLAKDPQRLTDLRSTLRDRMRRSPLMDSVGFARRRIALSGNVEQLVLFRHELAIKLS